MVSMRKRCSPDLMLKQPNAADLSQVQRHVPAHLLHPQAPEAIFCLHLLAALTELPDGIAYRMLVRVGIAVSQLRITALNYAEQGAPEHWHKTQREEPISRETAAFAAVDAQPRQDVETESELPALGEVTVQSPAVGRSQSRRGGRTERASDTASNASDRRQNGAGRRAGDRIGANGRRRDRNTDAPEDNTPSRSGEHALDQASSPYSPKSVET